MSRDLVLRSRIATYATLFGIVLGMLLATLVVPFVWGERRRPNVTASGDDGFGDDLPGATPTPGATLSPGAPGATTGPTAPTGVGPSGGLPGTQPHQPGGTSHPNTLPPNERLFASDRGVTATTIKLGFLLFDVGGASDFGFNFPGTDPELQQKAWDAYVAELNQHGGVLGRKVTPVYEKYDVLSPDSMRAACLEMTQTHKVFAVFDQGGIAGPSVLCFTEENGTLFFNLSGFGLPNDMYARSKGLLFTLFPSGQRSLRALAGELHRLGVLKRKRIGILADDFPDNVRAIDEGIVKTLTDHGYKIEHRENLAADTGTGASQIPLAVHNMDNANVDAVLVLTQSLFATQFVTQAENRNYVPKYFVGDWWGGYSDTYGQNMTEAFEGALAITTSRNGEWRKNYPEPAPEKRCREIYEKQTGTKLERGTLTYNSDVRQCAQLDVFVAAARSLGANLTRTRTSVAVQRLGTLALPHFGGGSFAPGKFDAADLVRTTRWQFACKCYLPVDNFRRPAG